MRTGFLVFIFRGSAENVEGFILTENNLTYCIANFILRILLRNALCFDGASKPDGVSNPQTKLGQLRNTAPSASAYFLSFIARDISDSRRMPVGIRGVPGEFCITTYHTSIP